MSSTDLATLKGVLARLTDAEKRDLLARLARELDRGEAKLLADQQANLRALPAELLALPVANPADAFSNVDHDAVIYGTIG